MKRARDMKAILLVIVLGALLTFSVGKCREKVLESKSTALSQEN